MTLPQGYSRELVIQSGGLRWKVTASYCKGNDNIEIELKDKETAQLIAWGKCAGHKKTQPAQNTGSQAGANIPLKPGEPAGHTSRPIKTGLYIWGASLFGLGIILAGVLAILKRKDNADEPPESPEGEQPPSS